jgi:hypothetical protein
MGRPLLQLACLLHAALQLQLPALLPAVGAVDICRVPTSTAAATDPAATRLVATRTKCSDVSAAARHYAWTLTSFSHRPV